MTSQQTFLLQFSQSISTGGTTMNLVFCPKNIVIIITVRQITVLKEKSYIFQMSMVNFPTVN